MESDYSIVVKRCLDVQKDIEVREDICTCVQMSPAISTNVPTLAPRQTPPVSMTGVHVLDALTVRLRKFTGDYP